GADGVGDSGGAGSAGGRDSGAAGGLNRRRKSTSALPLAPNRLLSRAAPIRAATVRERNYFRRSVLERDFGAEFNDPLPIVGAGYLPERGAGGRSVGRRELRVVQSIDELNRELKLRALPDARVFQQRKVPVIDDGRAHLAESRGQRDDVRS